MMEVYLKWTLMARAVERTRTRSAYNVTPKENDGNSRIYISNPYFSRILRDFQGKKWRALGNKIYMVPYGD
jgi:hypothetical protein